MNNSKGFGLIEILITILVLGIGLLGMASLTIKSLKGSASSQVRTHAIILSNGMLDRLRSNPDHAKNGLYNLALVDQPAPGVEVYATDLSVWMSQIQTQLPSGDGGVNCIDSLCEVTTQWYDNAETEIQRITLTSRI